jgi:hypothetical protein
MANGCAPTSERHPLACPVSELYVESPPDSLTRDAGGAVEGTIGDEVLVIFGEIVLQASPEYVEAVR